MQNDYDNISIVETQNLSEKQRQDIRLLVELCCRHDNIRLSYPADGESEEDKSEENSGGTMHLSGPRHWLYYGRDGVLNSALALVYYQDSLVECSAFTHPDFRRQGLFSRLLGCAVDRLDTTDTVDMTDRLDTADTADTAEAMDCGGDCDILFTVSGHCPDTAAALQALDAELASEEYQMELELTEGRCGDMILAAAPPCLLRKACPDPDLDGSADTVWELIHMADDGSAVLLGSCRTFMVSDACVCLHHVEILPQYRGQGFGYALIRCLLPLLCKEGFRRVILQVSGSNKAALALYKKTGFRITETLSLYLY